ncbi:hypothetical protein, partial [Vibrio campbellii]
DSSGHIFSIDAIIADQNESAYFSRYLHDSSMLVVGSPQALSPSWVYSVILVTKQFLPVNSMGVML